MNKSKRYAPVERERAVRVVFDQQGQHLSQWAAIQSIAVKVGCTAETLRRWVRQSETDQGKRSGIPSSDRERLKELERENRELLHVFIDERDRWLTYGERSSGRTRV